ncbi:hypothetical protein GQ55_3G156500 [Panicum hallii var. hallii]|uniref:Uncharacterized protein n=1 Tax=Panicum hallii var. hallii TaxID=1504633 RepID=A0A2T7E9X4_9POAL|nr:hypothetical protein GQ55_3G156500 [Panicum hallii var. hallii]
MACPLPSPPVPERERRNQGETTARAPPLCRQRERRPKERVALAVSRPMIRSASPIPPSPALLGAAVSVWGVRPAASPSASLPPRRKFHRARLDASRRTRTPRRSGADACDRSAEKPREPHVWVAPYAHVVWARLLGLLVGHPSGAASPAATRSQLALHNLYHTTSLSRLETSSPIRGRSAACPRLI